MYEFIGIELAIVGFIFSIVGSWFVSSKYRIERHTGYSYWVVGNPLNIIVIVGVMFGWWSGLPLIMMLVAQGYYLLTAYRGMKANA